MGDMLEINLGQKEVMGTHVGRRVRAEVEKKLQKSKAHDEWCRC